MCKILMILNKDPNNNPTLKKLVQLNAADLATQPNGFSVLRDSKVSFHMDYADFDNKISYSGEQLYICHTRISTSGARNSEQGLHLQSIAGWRFAHNGTVRKYSDSKVLSDSHIFFGDLIHNVPKLTAVNLATKMRETGFSGKGVMWRQSTKEMLIFMNQKLYVYALKDCLIFSTWALNTVEKVHQKTSVLGMEWDTVLETIPIEFLKTGDLDDKYLYFKDFNLVSLEALGSTTTYGYTGNSGYTGGYHVKPPVTDLSKINDNDLTAEHIELLLLAGDISKKKAKRLMKRLGKTLSKKKTLAQHVNEYSQAKEAVGGESESSLVGQRQLDWDSDKGERKIIYDYRTGGGKKVEQGEA